MKTVFLDRLYHKGEKCIRLTFDPSSDPQLDSICKLIRGMRWSNLHNCWYIESAGSSLREIRSYFQRIAHVNTDRLSHTDKPSILSKSKGDPDRPLTISERNHGSVTRFIFYMRSRRYSERTIDTYVKAIRVFFTYHDDKDVAELTNDDIIEFNNRYIVARRLSASFQNQVVNAIKLYYQVVHNVHLDPDLIKRPKRPRKLPNVLSMEEVTVILNNVRNLKHRTMLAMIYGCGLRRSELLNIRITDVDSNRMMLIIRDGKGMKDRMVPLSKNNLSMLREYYRAYRPKHYLFEGQDGGPYSARSLQSVFKQALDRTNIRKPASLHWLRHSYATHLLEHGTDIRVIQELLGHKSTKTTMIYTHVSEATINRVKSPIDRLNLSDHDSIF